MTDPPIPTRLNAPLRSYALSINSDGQFLFQFEKPAPWEEAEWIKKRAYDHGEVPPLNLEQAQIEQTANGDSLNEVIVYADELDVDQRAESDEGATDSDSRQGYITEFSDGKTIPEEEEPIHTQQQQNMGAAVDYLISEYDLIDEINIPYFPPNATRNCSINDKPAHPNGDEMRAPHELADGNHFLHTALNRRGKKYRVDDLAGQVELTADFAGEW